MSVKIRGISETKRKLAELIGDVQARKGVRAMTRVLTEISVRAALYTPIDTNTLLNSQFRQIRNDNTLLIGRVGYSAEYARYVHDPNVKQTFKRETARKEFLTQAAKDDDVRANISRIIKEELG